MAYVPRALVETARRALATFPSVLITGARQTGKTTLLRREFGDQFAYPGLFMKMSQKSGRSPCKPGTAEAERGGPDARRDDVAIQWKVSVRRSNEADGLPQPAAGRQLRE